jgi:hypothetical protein
MEAEGIFLILTEEELQERNRLLVLENDELNTENIKIKQVLKKVNDHLEGVMHPKRLVMLDCPWMHKTLSQALEELK